MTDEQQAIIDTLRAAYGERAEVDSDPDATVQQVSVMDLRRPSVVHAIYLIQPDGAVDEPVGRRGT